MGRFPTADARKFICNQVAGYSSSDERSAVSSRVYKLLNDYGSAESQLATLLLYAAQMASHRDPVLAGFLDQAERFYLQKLKEINDEDRARDADRPFTETGGFFFDWRQVLQKDMTRRN